MAQQKNYTASAESPFDLSPRRRLKEALLAGYDIDQEESTYSHVTLSLLCYNGPASFSIQDGGRVKKVFYLCILKLCLYFIFIFDVASDLLQVGFSRKKKNLRPKIASAEDARANLEERSGAQNVIRLVLLAGNRI